MKTNTFPVIDQRMVDDFLNSKKLTGWSDSMIKRVKSRLAVFCVDFSNNPQIVEDGLAGWEKQLEDRKLSACTIREYVTVVSQFLNYIGITEVKRKSKREIDLTGREFGNLKVLRKIGGRSLDRSCIWECQCSCGKIVMIPANQLTKGFHTSCGCQKTKRLSEANQYVDGTSLRMVFSDTIRSDNTSGCKGVYLKNGRWAVRIQYKGKRYYLGTFDKMEDAISARKKAEEKIREACTEEFLSEHRIIDVSNLNK